MDVRFIAGFGPVAPDLGASRAFYIDALGLPLTGDASQLLDGDASYLHTTAVEGAKHFAVWPLAEAAPYLASASVTPACSCRWQLAACAPLGF